MTGQQSVIWFIANAIVIVAVLTIGTLGAADLLTRRGRAEQRASLRPRESSKEDSRLTASGEAPSLDSVPGRAGRPQDVGSLPGL